MKNSERLEPPAPIYRAAIVGLGFIGAGDDVSGAAIGGQRVSDLDGTHAEALSRHSRVELVAGSSRDAGRRERFTTRTQCSSYDDWRQMLDSEHPDIVSIATYSPVHCEIALASVRKGVRAIYCEKPIATRLEDARQMVSECEKAGVLLVINHNRRFNPNYRRLRNLVAAGELGELTSASIRWGGGRLGNVGTHLIDAATMLTGRKACAVSATLDLSHKPDCRGAQFHDPGGFGWMRLDGGLMTAVDAADYGKGGASLILNGTLGRALTGGGDVNIEYWDGRTDHWPVPQGQTSMDRAISEIVETLDNGTSFPVKAIDAVHTLETILAFHVSHTRRSAWVELPLENDDRTIELKSA